nr:Hypothetical protein FSTVLC9_290 [Faustovirus]
MDYPYLPPEIMEMVVDYMDAPTQRMLWQVNKAYNIEYDGNLRSTIGRYESMGSLTVRAHHDIIRLFINMCRWPVFDKALVTRVVRILLNKFNGYTHLLVFMAIGYNLSMHMLENLIRNYGDEFKNAYENIHRALNYNQHDNTYDLRNDIIIELAATRPESVDFITQYIYMIYKAQYCYRTYRPLYQFRDCISVTHGKNILDLARKKICDTPSTSMKTPTTVDQYMIMAFCEIELDSTNSFEKCISMLKLQPQNAGITNMRLMVHIYEYFVYNVIKYKQQH